MGPRVFRGSESQQRGLAGSSRRPEAGVPPSHISSQTILSRGPGAGIGRLVQPGQMETRPTPCQAQGARTSQEMGPCASLSVSQEPAGHRNELHPLPRGPEAPSKPSSPPGDMVQSQSGPPGTARCGVVLMATGRVEPHGTLPRGPSPSAGMCTPAFCFSSLGTRPKEGRWGRAAARRPAPLQAPLQKGLLSQRGDPCTCRRGSTNVSRLVRRMDSAVGWGPPGRASVRLHCPGPPGVGVLGPAA